MIPSLTRAALAYARALEQFCWEDRDETVIAIAEQDLERAAREFVKRDKPPRRHSARK